MDVQRPNQNLADQSFLFGAGGQNELAEAMASINNNKQRPTLSRYTKSTFEMALERAQKNKSVGACHQVGADLHTYQKKESRAKAKRVVHGVTEAMVNRKAINIGGVRKIAKIYPSKQADIPVFLQG